MIINSSRFTKQSVMKALASATVLAFALPLATIAAESPSLQRAATNPVPATGAEVQSPALQQVTLAVPGMDCPMCPITVRRALARVDGVVEAKADLRTKQAHVRFDPARTSIGALIEATTNAGFSSSLME
jgi:periplasmic mercuric ion binding protein